MKNCAKKLATRLLSGKKEALLSAIDCKLPVHAAAASRFFGCAATAATHKIKTSPPPPPPAPASVVMQMWALTAFLCTYLPPATRHPLNRAQASLWCGVLSLLQLLWQQLRQSCIVLLTQIPEYPEKCKFLWRRVLLSSRQTPAQRDPALPSSVVGRLCTCTWVKFKEKENWVDYA